MSHVVRRSAAIHSGGDGLREVVQFLDNPVKRYTVVRLKCFLPFNDPLRLQVFPRLYCIHIQPDSTSMGDDVSFREVIVCLFGQTSPFIKCRRSDEPHIFNGVRGLESRDARFRFFQLSG